MTSAGIVVSYGNEDNNDDLMTILRMAEDLEDARRRIAEAEDEIR